MNQLKKTTFTDRIRNAWRSLRGEPVRSISFGLEVKNCRECDRGDCKQCCYKHEFERLMNLPNCNDCHLNDTCGARPKLGETVRINCPMHIPKVKENTEK